VPAQDCRPLDVNIGNLQDRTRHSAEDQIYIQSENGYRVGRTLNENVWYRLEQPAIGYSSLFTDFLWVADLVKHFLDYMTINADIDQEGAVAPVGKVQLLPLGRCSCSHREGAVHTNVNKNFSNRGDASFLFINIENKQAPSSSINKQP
jgi:hypothetical protein